MFIYQKKNWPQFRWDAGKISDVLVSVSHKHDRPVGRMEGMGFHLQSEATLNTISLDVLKSRKIDVLEMGKDE